MTAYQCPQGGVLILQMIRELVDPWVRLCKGGRAVRKAEWSAGAEVRPLWIFWQNLPRPQYDFVCSHSSYYTILRLTEKPILGYDLGNTKNNFILCETEVRCDGLQDTGENSGGLCGPVASLKAEVCFDLWLTHRFGTCWWDTAWHSSAGITCIRIRLCLRHLSHLGWDHSNCSFLAILKWSHLYACHIVDVVVSRRELTLF